MRELKNIKIRNHDLYYNDNSENWPVHAKAFFEAIKNGPDFFCVSCLRCFFKDQVIGLSEKMKMKKIVIKGEDISWFNDAKSIDDGYYLCRCCHGHLSGNNLPKMAAANGNKLPVVPDFISNLNQGEERLIAPRTFFLRLQKLGIGGQKGIKSNAVNIPVPLEKTVSLLPLTSTENNSVISLDFKRKLKYDHSYFTMNVDLEKICAALYYYLAQKYFHTF